MKDNTQALCAARAALEAAEQARMEILLRPCQVNLCLSRLNILPESQIRETSES